MKHLYLFLLGLIAFAANAQIQINTPESYHYCDQDGNGTETINLSDYNAYILGSNNPEEYSVKYFLTEENAQQNILQLPQIYTFSTSTTPQQLFVKVTENANTGNFAVTFLDIRRGVMPVIPNLSPIPSLNCAGTYDLTYNNYVYDPMTINTIDFYTSQNDANTGQDPINQPDYYRADQGSVWVRISNSSAGCFAVAEQRLMGVFGPEATVAVNGQTAIINTVGAAPFEYSIISGPPSGSYPTTYQSSNIFTNLEPGIYTIQVRDNCLYTIVITFMVTASPEPPTGETSQTFTEGQTLADLEVSGDNIQWYDAPTGGNLLPVTTLLVDNTTYYAERSLNRARLANRLAVTVHLVLSTNGNSLQTLSYYPNPVKNVLNLKNASAINSVAIYNTLGQQVLNSAVNTTETNLDLSALSNGIYFVKVQAGESSKTIRIVKK